MSKSVTGLLVAVSVSVMLAVLMWGMAIAVASYPRRGAVLPRPVWPWTATSPSARAAMWMSLVFAATCVFVVVTMHWTPSHLPAVVLVIFGLPAAYTDARELRLPDKLTYPLAGTAIGTVAILSGLGLQGSIVRALACGVGYAAVLLVIALGTPTGRPEPGAGGTASAPTAATALGLGDIKLAVGLGLVLGWSSLAALTAALAVTALGHLQWLIGCTMARRLHRRGMNGSALGPWMVLGAILALIS